MSMMIVETSSLATVQDLGRTGVRAFGIASGGVMDKDSAVIVNLLVGNEMGAALVEFAQPGIVVRFSEPALIAVGGACTQLTLDGANVPMWQTIAVQKGSLLSCAALTGGVWCYLAVSGGIDVPVWQGSRSTDLRCAAGGYKGRRLQKGDILSRSQSASKASTAQHKPFVRAQEPLRPREWFDVVSNVAAHIIRVVAGEHGETRFGTELSTWLKQPFRVNRDMNRMGYRLDGQPLMSVQDSQLPSQPVVPGTIQLPPSGLPIVLMADSQTIGGYPVIGHVIEADLGAMAQIGVGQWVCFQLVTYEVARSAHLRQIREWNQLKVGLSCWPSI